MSENLKVNAKSDILEFKRKHNLLVDVVPQKDTDGNYKIFENIIDSQGHKRFIEGNINLSSSITGFTQTYGKWSLSGTHLMIVLAGNVENEIQLTPIFLANVILPEWIYNKIFATFGDVVEIKSVPFYARDWGNQNVSIALRKGSNNMYLYIASSITMSSDKTFRIAFDLLIDNEEPQEQGE